MFRYERGRNRRPPSGRGFAAQALTYVGAAAVGPVLVVLVSMTTGADSKDGPIDIHSLPVYYNGKHITWPRATVMLQTRDGLTMDIDVRRESNQRVVIFNSERAYQRWLCTQRYSARPCSPRN